MSKSRMEMLEAFVRQQPNDSFAHYGLALEYATAGRNDDALALFQKLLGFNPNYTAAYYHAGVLLGKLGRVEEARALFERGIEVASRNGDFHTKSELEQALHDLSS
ncbi:MAG: tetratricopeptide repeat protein [Acidobacteria bacterium]|nr:tetratricopeptide repeat protein [Acidobacteriota bacterium]